MRLLFDLEPKDPALGLAVDEVVLDSVRQGGSETARIWVNASSIIVGRSQCVAAEVDEAQARACGIPVFRRASGGGTVFHYPGNLNLSIIVRKRDGLATVTDVFAALGGAVAAALAVWVPGLRVEDNGLYAGHSKVGGAAQAHRGDTILYHTTVLVHPVPLAMERVLLALREEYRSEGVASRPRPTTSLEEAAGRSLSLEQVGGAMIDELASVLGSRLSLGALTSTETDSVAAMAAEKYRSRQWNRRL